MTSTNADQARASGKIDGHALRLIAVLAFVGALGPFAIDTYLPALPAMAEALPATATLMKWTVSAYLLGIAVFPLFLSPLADALGRLPVLYGALIAFAVISAGCALAPDIESFGALRFLQAAAGGTAMTATRAIMADLYKGDALSRATSILMLIFTAAPVVAPLWGAWMLEIGDWRWIFWSLSLVGVAALVLGMALPETLTVEKKRPYKIAQVIRNYVEIAKNNTARRYLLASFASSFMFFAMLAGSPFIFIEHFDVSAVNFSIMFASISGAAFAANMLNARLVMKRGYPQMLRDTTKVLLVLAVFLSVIAATGWWGMWGVFGVMVWLMGCYHVISANSTAGLMTELGNQAGAAAAVLALGRFVGGALGAWLIGAIGTSHPWSFAVILATAAIGMHLAMKIGSDGARA
ncbi:MAG: multidrug effflux MFS transporter [Pikeienuella sp.]